MATAPTIQLPTREELAKSRGNGTLVGQPFVELLTTEDQVLLTKGRDYKLYRETLRDDQCAATFSDRRLAVTSREWGVDASSDAPLDVAAADFIRAALERLDFDRITDGMLYARWYGHAVGECLWSTDGTQIHLDDIRVRDRSRFAYSNDRGAPWLLNTQGMKWERMPERKFWTVSTGADHDDQPYGLGLAHYCYWPVYFKRNNLKFWLVFAEKFGSPTAMGKIPGGKWADLELREAVLDALQCFSSESAIVVPEEAAVELLEAARSGAGTYDQLFDRMDAAIAKVIIGQTASSQGTPGKLGNDQLQGSVRDDLVKADADMVCSSFNRGPITWLTEWNFPGAIPPTVWRKTEPDADLKVIADTDTAIKGLGFTPDEEYIKERYGSHWSKAAPLQLGGPGLPGFPGTQPGQPGNPGPGASPSAIDAAAQFAEMGAIATLKAGKRADQDAMKSAASFLASRYESVLGDRVDQLMAFADETGDYVTFQKRLVEMVGELPPTAAVESVKRASFVSRLLGYAKAQR